MSQFKSIISVILLYGTVDQINDGLVLTEVKNSNLDDVHMSLPLEIFPCEIKEGDYFYFEYTGGVTEIRCGEPPI